MLTPVDFEKEIGIPNDLRQLKVIGSFAIEVNGLTVSKGGMSESRTRCRSSAD